MRKIRCAIYTRKSTEEGLEQDFNSLDAQREACEAYIKSQKNEGWVLLDEQYNAGGYSGGTMERSAFKKLLKDIENDEIDIVVVYKVDRLTRSLMDFSKIIDVFDTHHTSFVSITQQFNTTTSMGRLTLNILLSFAQFEREVTGERIRDKFAASKKKGLWMGGVVPLGYDKDNRMSQNHSNTRKKIYRYYLSQSVLGFNKDKSGSVTKIPALDIEKLVKEEVTSFLKNTTQIQPYLATLDIKQEIEIIKYLEKVETIEPAFIRRLILRLFYKPTGYK